MGAPGTAKGSSSSASAAGLPCSRKSAPTPGPGTQAGPPRSCSCRPCCRLRFCGASCSIHRHRTSCGRWTDSTLINCENSKVDCGLYFHLAILGVASKNVCLRQFSSGVRTWKFRRPELTYEVYLIFWVFHELQFSAQNSENSNDRHCRPSCSNDG